MSQDASTPPARSDRGAFDPTARGTRFYWALLLLAAPVVAQALKPYEITGALNERRYEFLSTTLAGYRGAYAEGAIDEATYDRLLSGFRRLGEAADDGTAGKIDGWVAARPGNGDALLARGIYRASRGWTARGTQLARDTPPESFRQMSNEFAVARTDLAAAQRILGRCDLCLNERIAMSRADRGENAAALFAQALRDNPNAALAPLSYAAALEERWGGPPGALPRFVQEFCARQPTPAACGPLQARMAAERSRRALDAGDLVAAEADRALAADPLHIEVWKQKAWLLQRRGAYPQALRLYDAIASRGAADAWAYSSRAWIHLQYERADLALSDYEAAAELGDQDALAQALGMLIGGRYGIARVPERAVAMCQRMVDRQHAAGALCLGELHYSGHGVPRDIRQAAAWYARAAEQGNVKAKTALGILKWTGADGVPQDKRGASRLWRQARDGGDKAAVERLRSLGWLDALWYVTLPDLFQRRDGR